MRIFSKAVAAAAVADSLSLSWAEYAGSTALINPLFAVEINVLLLKVHGGGFVGLAAKAFVCHGMRFGLKSDPEAISKLISFVASAK